MLLLPCHADDAIISDYAAIMLIRRCRDAIRRLLLMLIIYDADYDYYYYVCHG